MELRLIEAEVVSALAALTVRRGLADRVETSADTVELLAPIAEVRPEVGRFGPDAIRALVVEAIEHRFAGGDRELLRAAFNEYPNRTLAGLKKQRLEWWAGNHFTSPRTARRILRNQLLPRLARVLLDPVEALGVGPSDGFAAGLGPQIARHRRPGSDPTALALSAQRLSAAGVGRLTSDADAIEMVARAINLSKVGWVVESDWILGQLTDGSLSDQMTVEVLLAKAKNRAQLGEFAHADLLLDHVGKLIGKGREEAIRRTLLWRTALTKSVLGDQRTARYFADAHRELAKDTPHQLAVSRIYGEFLGPYLRSRRSHAAPRELERAIEATHLYPSSPDLGVRYTHPEVSQCHGPVLEVFRSARRSEASADRAAIEAGAALHASGASPQAEGVGELIVGIRQLDRGAHLEWLIGQAARTGGQGPDRPATP